MPTIAILGAGIFAREAYLPALKALGDSVPHLSAVYSRSQKSAEELAAAAKEQLGLLDSLAVYHEADPKSNLDALLARPDIIAVIIALPITTQPSIILKALAAGKHVLSEKPVAADVTTGLKLIETYRSTYESKGLVWRVAENFEAEPGYRAAGEAVQQGKIGKINFFKATVTNYIDTTSKWYNTAWRTVPDYQGGFVLDGGVHTIAALRTILPEPFTHLSAFASLNKEILKPIDTIHVIIKAGQHFHGVIDMTWASPTPSTPDSYELVITGTQGYITVKNVTIDGKTIRRVVIKSIKAVDGNLGEDEEKVIDEAHKGIEVEVKSFLAAVDKQDTLAIGDPLKALGDVAVIQAALNSDGSLIDIQSLLQKGH